MKKMTVEASWDDGPETKTARQSDGSILWSPGDKINLFYGGASGSEFTTTITTPSSSASFTGYLQAATGSAEQGIATQSFWGVYPYDAANTCDGNGVYLTVKGTQVASPGTFGEGMNPAVGKSPGLSLSFKNVGSWFVFSVTQSGITSVKFSGNNGEDIAGKVYVTMDSSGKPVSRVVEGEGLKSITVTPETGNEFIPGTDYFITLIPQTLSQGYTFTMYTGDGRIATRKIGDSKTFVLSQRLTGRKIDTGLTFQTLWVDMGDGIMWATMNVGADSPEEYGDYFAWAETAPKNNYSWSTYSYGTQDNLTKYNTSDGLTVLQPEDDAATVNWGGDWRTPTSEEWNWLYDNCTWTWQYNPQGYNVTSKRNGNTIFLPAAGYYWEMYSSNSKGYYWSSDINAGYLSSAYIRMFDAGSNKSTDSDRSVGRSVRPVKGVSAASRYVELAEGVKWATMNIGANAPEESGNYYAWGETRPKSEYSNTNYAFGTYRALTKYVNNSEFGTVDGRTALLPVDDAATVAWGGDWRTPTQEEWNWLKNNCNVETATENGVSGYRFTSKVAGYTDKSIFIPAAGFYSYNDPTTVREGFSYWTSVMCDDGVPYQAWMVDPYNNREERFTGRPVRAVYMPRVALTSFAIQEESVTVGVELRKSLSTECTPANATERGAIWTSSNENVAKVSGWGEVTGVSPGTATITAVSLDGGFRATCTVTVIQSYVDMGGGMEWATFNVGADAPTESGEYYAWGMTSPRAPYTWNNYLLGSENNIRYYNSTDGLVHLLPNHDAATVQMGGLWHTPSTAEWTWLKENCDWNWVSDYQNSGVPGFVVTSPETSGSIFLPAAGQAYDGNEPSLGTGRYWASNLYESSTINYKYAAEVYLYQKKILSIAEERYHGKTIRAVRRKWVDMGDGLKWATTNVGGFNPEDYGDYFAWGEIKTKDDYSWSTYKWGTSSTTLTKYVTDEAWGTKDNQTRLIRASNTTDDAAFANWGASWRMPTDDEWTWLQNNCNWEWTTQDGVNGRKVTSKTTGNSIFLPAAGYCYGTSHGDAGSYGLYWSSSLDTSYSSDAWCVFFMSSNFYRLSYIRYVGQSVRPVSD